MGVLPDSGLLLVAVAWIAYRVFLVFQKPIEELEEVLGIDIPPVPDITLSGITSNSVLLYWKPPENYHSPLKYGVQVNGINGTFERSDATIQVTGLQPGHCYGIRAVHTNATGNSSYSNLIQVQTIPLGGHRGQKLLANADQSHTLTKRSNATTGRRVSQPIPSSTQDAASRTMSGAGDGSNDETIARLTEKLEMLKEQEREAREQLAADEEEARDAQAELIRERDELKRMVEEKEKASLEFKKQVIELEKQCKAAQRKKSAKERLLQQKKAERQKIKDDILRWETECIEMEEDVKDLREQKADLEGAHELKMAQAQKMIKDAQDESARMEDELRDLGIQVKALEEERARADREHNAEEEEAERREREEEAEHEKRIQDLQSNYAVIWRLSAQAETQAAAATERLEWLLRFKANDPSAFAPVPGLDYPITSFFPTPRRQRNSGIRGGHINLNSPSYSNHSAFNSTSSASPTFSSAFPFYGSPAHQAIGETVGGLTQRDVENLTGGAPMSPSADTLLPSGLLGDDDESRAMFGRSINSMHQGIVSGEDDDSRAIFGRHIGSLSQGLRPPSTDKANREPQSPRSVDSKSASLFSSPHESMSNINKFYSGDHPGPEDEAGSIASADSPYAIPLRAISNGGSSRKISGLFNFNRQRDKGGLAELPALGTLKQGQSQSFPVNLEDPTVPTSGGRRKGANIWSNTMSVFNTRGAGAQTGDDGFVAGLGTRKTRRGMFGSKLEPSEALGSPVPRPSSTYSFDAHGLRGPGQQFGGWSTPDPTRPRGATLDNRTSFTGPWAHGQQSRRDSLQYGSTSNLSIGSTPLDPATADHFPVGGFGGFGGGAGAGNKPPPPAPIGTERFRVGQRSNTPKLNPAAPSFTTRFFTRGDSKKTPKTEKNAELGAAAATSSTTESEKHKESSEQQQYSKTSSPSMSRISQDYANSIATSSASVAGESYDSLEPSISATHSETGAGGNSTTATASNTPKETLMQRITRKSSSSKFSVPWSKSSASTTGSIKGSKAAAAAAAGGGPSTPSGDLEEGDFEYMGRSAAESTTSTPGTGTPSGAPSSVGGGGGGGSGAKGSSLTWSRLTRKDRRAADKTGDRGDRNKDKGKGAAANGGTSYMASSASETTSEGERGRLSEVEGEEEEGDY